MARQPGLHGGEFVFILFVLSNSAKRNALGIRDLTLPYPIVGAGYDSKGSVADMSVTPSGFALRMNGSCSANQEDCGGTVDPYRICCPKSSFCPHSYNVDVSDYEPSSRIDRGNIDAH